MKKLWHGGLWIAGLALVGLGVAVAVRSATAGPDAEAIAQASRSQTVLSETYTVDRIYRSMMGPYSEQSIRVGSVAAKDSFAKDAAAKDAKDAEDDGLVWITGYRAVMVAEDGESQLPQEFMCHSNLDLDVLAHEEVVGASPGFNPRLFTLSQGQFEIQFPTGFGIPVRANEALQLTTQVLNLNEEDLQLKVRHRVTIDYVRDDELGPGMRPLFPTAAYGLASIDGQAGHFGIETPDEEVHGPGCLTGDNASDHTYEDGLGRKFSGHWQVPPGRQVNRTLVTHLMQVPYETTLHYIAVHLHPFAESLELRDLTSGETLFRSLAENVPGRVGLVKVDAFSSAEGIWVYPDHEYELVSVYNNTSQEMQDSMAVMYLYLHDKEVQKRLRKLRSTSS